MRAAVVDELRRSNRGGGQGDWRSTSTSVEDCMESAKDGVGDRDGVRGGRLRRMVSPPVRVALVLCSLNSEALLPVSLSTNKDMNRRER